MICTFFNEVQRKEIREVDFVGENSRIILLYCIYSICMCHPSAERCGIKTYPALLLCLNKIFFCIVFEVLYMVSSYGEYMQENY
jgi:hypothetical protein